MSTNISKIKREQLAEKIAALREYIARAPQDANTANLLQYISEIEKDIKGKKYGLVFEEHRESIDEVLENHLPVLTEEEELLIDNGGTMNFLIEGDNLASLKLLEKTHAGRIDLIYIDPPYNTGNKDFVYDDAFIDSNDTFRHSKWLSFMEKRLKIAKNLLTDNGVIFISIDDNEQANLSMLCNEIFGEVNLVANLIWRKKYGGGKGTRFVVDLHEYVLCYCKNINILPDFLYDRPEEKMEIFSMSDEYVETRGKYYIRPLKSGLGYRATLIYPIECPDGSTITTQWICAKTTYEQLLKEGRIVFKKLKDGSYNVYKKFYSSDKGGLVHPDSILYDIAYNQNGKEEIKKIFNVKEGRDIPFQNPKPTALIKFILTFMNNKNPTVLDFFAGSGSTGHAVMKLNAEDGGQRKFILCTNNENNICRDVTYERIKRVIDKEDYKASLKYMRVDYVPISEQVYYEYADELLSHVRELVELENGINFRGNNSIAIVLTDEELNDFVHSDAVQTCKTLYHGHDVTPDDVASEVISRYGIKVNVIPEYYYSEMEE